ncbi:MAG: NHL repeat-containing protein [Candidatus Solibacter usitatus]|nr:NHL repeat-containing protein [Candidatus Solibacter usitatus]
MEYRHTRVMGGKLSGPEWFGQSLRGLCTGRDGRLYAAGDSQVMVFDPAGKLLRRWATAKPGCSIHLAADGRLFVGQAGQVEIFDGTGKLERAWQGGWLGEVTAVRVHGNETFVADAAARCIRRYDRELKHVNDIGKENRTNGFLIPNGVLDFDVDSAGGIHAANPGKHRVERYTREGKLLGHIGRFDGIDPEGFPGCCNPTNMALGPEGRVLVTEKAEPRAKVLDAEGKLLAVLGTKVFDAGSKNMAVAADFRGRVYVAETVKLQILVFEPVRERTEAR